MPIVEQRGVCQVHLLQAPLADGNIALVDEVQLSVVMPEIADRMTRGLEEHPRVQEGGGERSLKLVL